MVYRLNDCKAVSDLEQTEAISGKRSRKFNENLKAIKNYWSGIKSIHLSEFECVITRDLSETAPQNSVTFRHLIDKRHKNGQRGVKN